MPRLYMVTVPGLDVKSDWQQVHDRLVDEFPDITDVLATTIPETVLIVYEGRADIDAWLEAVTEAILLRRITTRARRRTERPLERAVGPCAARRSRPHTTSSFGHNPNTGRNPA